MKVWIFISVLLGVLIGLCIPYSFYTDCPTPLFDICGHIFWDWVLRILQVVGTLLAVVVALFKEPLQRWLVRPNLNMELSSMHEQLVKDGDNDIANAYSGKIKVSNVGSNKANNVIVSIEKIVYRKSENSQTPQILLDQSSVIKAFNGKDIACLPTDDEVFFPWLNILKAQSQDVEGAVQAIPMKLMIGSKEIGGACFSGLLDVTFKLKCDELKPQYKTLRMEWNGEWKGRQVDMVKVLSYEWYK